MSDTVINKVVDQGLCVGCGVCAGICPGESLEIKFNDFGEYVPQKIEQCLKGCSICLRVCPFFSENENEDILAREQFSDNADVRYRRETGFVLGSYYGYRTDANLRLKSASGGIASWLLEELLTQKKVNGVICVASNPGQEKLFKFKICRSAKEIRAASGSVYYPAELSEAIRFILGHEGTFGLVGLPCFIKAIRLAQKKFPRLREKIKYLIGLTCGQLKNKEYTSFIAAMAGVKDKVQEVFYRGKKFDRAANNFAFEVIGTGGPTGTLLWDDGVGDVWGNRWFTLNACNFCDDVFAETADVALMDAWLPEYVRDSEGANLVISRSGEIDTILQTGKALEQLHLDKIGLDRIIKSQASVLSIKRKHLAYRLYLAREAGPHIRKRVAPSRWSSPLEHKEIRLKDEMQFMSKRLFCAMTAEGDADPKKMFMEFKAKLDVIAFSRRFRSILSAPIRVVSKCLDLFLKNKKKTG